MKHFQSGYHGFYPEWYTYQYIGGIYLDCRIPCTDFLLNTQYQSQIGKLKYVLYGNASWVPTNFHQLKSVRLGFHQKKSIIGLLEKMIIGFKTIYDNILTKLTRSRI